MRILIIEDEVRLAGTLSDLLRRQGYATDICHDGPTGLDNAAGGIYDLILLDAMLPGLDGFSLLQQLRGGGNTTPVLMLTARSDVSDRVRGLDSGADYYLTKPFDAQELLACVRLLLRRSGQESRTDDAITCGDLRLEPGTFLLCCGQRSVRLSRREYDLMELLMKNPRRVYSREDLMNLVWGYSYAGDYRTVDVHIRRLREKLEKVPAEPVYIMTKWGVGYYFKGESQPTV